MSSEWAKYALADNVFAEYVCFRKHKPAANKRNVDRVRDWKHERELGERVEERSKRINANPSFYQPFRNVRGFAWWDDAGCKRQNLSMSYMSYTSDV